MKRRICVLMMFLCLLCFTGCKPTVTVDTLEVSVTTEDLVKTAPLVFLGKVKSQGEGWYRNAEEVHYYEDGHTMFNYWITPYTVEVLEVYKGDLKEEIAELTVGTYNMRSPDKKKIEGEEPFYLNEGDTAIFCVSYNEVDECYKPIYGNMGVFYPDKTMKKYTSCGNWIDVSDMDNLLKQAEISGTDRAAIAGQKVDIKAEHKKLNSPAAS